MKGKGKKNLIDEIVLIIDSQKAECIGWAENFNEAKEALYHSRLITKSTMLTTKGQEVCKIADILEDGRLHKWLKGLSPKEFDYYFSDLYYFDTIKHIDKYKKENVNNV